VEHLAIDLGGRESQICVRRSEGSIIAEDRISNEQFRELFARPKARVVLETCAEAFAVADLALEQGHEVRVVPASLVRALGVGARRTKTDRRDAQVLSEVSCRINLPSVHVPSHWSREAKSLCGMRDALVQSRTQLVNTVRGYLRRHLKRLRGGSIATLPERTCQRFAEVGRDVPRYLQRQLAMIKHLHESVKEATQEVKTWAEQNPVCVRLMTVPGVGPITAVRFVAAIDSVERFSSAHQLEAYLGLTPGEDSSSDRKRITSITKAGPIAVRWTLVQATWSALRTRPDDPMCRWALQIARRRGLRIAVIALARKLAGILFALWRDGTTYKPCLGAAAIREVSPTS
jgi:transposase